MYDNKNTYVWGRLVTEATLTSVLTALDLPWDYTVLAAARSPRDPGQWFVLLQRSAQYDPYVVYRVDPRDGSCHGGSYVADLLTGWQRFAERAMAPLAAEAVELALRASGVDAPFSVEATATFSTNDPASLTPTPPSSEDRALFARVAAFMEDDGSISDGERHALLEDVLERAEQEDAEPGDYTGAEWSR